jgi:hypothetical protein
MVVALAPLPTLLGHCCHPNTGVIADLALALLPLLLLQHWHHPGRGLAFDVPADAKRHPHCTRVPASIMLALSPSMHLHCCQHCAGIFALVVLVPLPLSRWHCCPSRARSHCHPHAQPRDILPSSWRLHCPRDGTVANVAWALSLLLRWHPCRCCPGAVAIVTIVALV